MDKLILLREWQSSQVEFWRKTKYEGYDVSSFGRVRSYWIIVANKGWSNGARGELSTIPTIISGAKSDSSGYPYLNARPACPKIHRLVAEAFIPNPENKPEVNHKTGLKSDNRVDGLEWVTRLENIRHAVAIGLKDYKKSYGDKHYNSKISDERIIEMQSLYDQGWKPIQLAEKFNVTLANVYDLAKGVRGRGKTLREKN
jgi:hypothetical protein